MLSDYVDILVYNSDSGQIFLSSCVNCDTFANMQIFISSLLFCKSKTAVVKYFRINQHKGILPVMKNNKLLVKYFSTQFWWNFALAVGANLVRSWPMVNEKADHCNQNVPSDRYDSCECVSLTCFNFWLVFRLVQTWVQLTSSSLFIFLRVVCTPLQFCPDHELLFNGYFSSKS